MKSFITRFFAMVIALMSIATAGAQQIPTLPLDPQIRYGQLPNGLTYMIRHNEYPKGQADFFIAQKVGSILEEDSQRGLAHFLEHMCFNGTKAFPGTQVRDWLATKGVMFGRDLNAYTSFDETVYNISSVPVGNVNVEDSCLMILHDWSHDLLLLDEEIQEERGVIEQEWRMRNVGQMRILEQMLPKVFPGRYGNRLPIGTMDVVLNFAPDTLRDYYHKWYRPDQQGIIVVGDIDVDRIEAKIKEMFSDIAMPEAPVVREYYELPDHEGTVVAIGSDPEQPYGMVQMIFAFEAMPREMRNTPAYLVQQYLNYLASSILNERYNDITMKPDAPFASASASFGEVLGFVKTKESLSLGVLAKDGGDVATSLAAAYRELLRAVRGGVTQSEVERARAQYIASLEKAVNDINSHPSTDYAREYVNYFIDNTATPGIESELAFIKNAAPMITAEMVNAFLKETVTPNNRYVLGFIPEREGFVVPTEDAIMAALAAIDAEDIEPLKDATRQDPLVATPPVPGTITEVSTLDRFGAEVWTLSNGAKVYVKPTKLKEDEVIFNAFAPIGVAGYQAMSDATARVLPYVGAFGLLAGGTYNTADIRKMLAGKVVDLSVSLGEFETEIEGHSSVKDLPDMLELFYATYLTPNLDTEEWSASQSQLATILASAATNPQLMFQKYANQSLYRAPRSQMTSADDVKEASRDEILAYINTINKNAAAYTFCIVGNVDTATLRPLVEKYIASLPAEAMTVTATAFDPAYGVTPGKETSTYSMAMQTPQTWVQIIATGNEEPTAKNRILAAFLTNVANYRLINEIREKQQAVYSISGRARVRFTGTPNTSLSTSVPMKPELADKAIDSINEIFASLATDITPDEFNRAKEVIVKDYTEAKEKNDSWLGAMQNYLLYGVDTLNDAIDIANSITAEEVAAFAKDLLSQGNLRVVRLNPEQ